MPIQNNWVVKTELVMQALLNRIAQLEQGQNLLCGKTNQGCKNLGGKKGPQLQGQPKDLRGRTHTVHCANCGVRLAQGKCKDGCIRAKRGHCNLPFLAQVEAGRATFDNRLQFGKASDRSADKWGKEWSECMDPCIAEQARK